MDQTQAKTQGVQQVPHNWTRSEWFGLVGGFGSAPLEEPIAESPAKIPGTTTLKAEPPETVSPEQID